MKKFVVVTSLFWVLVAGCVSKPMVDLTPVKAVLLSQYLGTWYEIARFDHWFERDMTHAKAFYEMREDGDIRVTNTGLKKGKERMATAIAKKTAIPGLLRVSFFRPFYGDYRILWLDSDYRYALVGGDDADFLWILAREQTISDEMREILLAEAKRRGYNTAHLIWVKQE